MTQSTAPAAPPTDPVVAELLQSVVDVARAIFGAEASSIMLLDHQSFELVFQAVSGQGQEFLIGRRFPAGQGIAGWVAGSGEPMIVDDLRRSASFDRTVAKSTGYVPDAMMAAPLVHGDRVLGVLEVLDPAPGPSRAGLPELELLALFARQAGVALRVAVDNSTAVLGAEERDRAMRLLTEVQRLIGDRSDW
ncbi:histidine kinase [Kitasatospora griseola]|uniref:Histidine kinase n=1 Tax=Kitasatospora griseola TaxID=2064 RepID=A0A0D0Q6T4_KITGR|nr:GAF domain-containing protein [Kitasatospora griseola]KIQ66833.1 histidine kinase [Kitasatospora griseola]